MKVTFEAIRHQQGWIEAVYYDEMHKGTIRFEMADPIEVRDDLVAEALAALCGQYYDTIEMEWKVSQRTKQQIEKRTGAQLVCKTRMLFWNINKMMRQDVKTLNFNGDVYNLSALALTPGDVNYVSLDFGQESAYMYDMFDEWQSRIVKTNVMDTHFPLITSDYYMIGSILYKDFFNTTYMVTGLQLNPLTVNMTKIDAEQAIAGMINMPHSLGLTAVGHTKIACQRWPHMLEQACDAVRTSQPYIGAQQRMLIDIENERGRLGLGTYANQVQPTHISWGTDQRLDFLALYILKYGGRAQAEKLVQHIPVEAETLVQQCDFQFYERYYPGVLHYMEKSIREAVQQQLEKYGVLLFSEMDWQNFMTVRTWIQQTRR
ncbi:hypothetical protein [Staphylococcus cornubiensis]|uniref:hypothetical protein n=1 Tax=Staphylococcus cornubiensis TaxID=1986155 RepID=UPI000A380020|nr:hypothetical protein [Staphylococcus cornubiensis]